MHTKNIHSFHIPVMGLAYTIDSPIRLANYGIRSVVSIVDDELLESMSAFYSRKFHLPYQAFTKKMVDYRANRISTYLNLVDKIVKQKFDSFKKELLDNKTALEEFIGILPLASEANKKLKAISTYKDNFKKELQLAIEKYLHPGEIDVNIMTKVDKENFDGKEQLDIEYNDAHAALRGFANSNLESSVVFSAGMNPRLYSYLSKFDDFFPDENNHLKKRIILKVSDYRSAFIQGQFLAKKGLWVSEYRIESGLNCGGHAFASEGSLLGPVLQEFKDKKEELSTSLHTLFTAFLQKNKKHSPKHPMNIEITVQGGVGTAEEHQFLLDNFEVDSVGWGSPFLLVPEATAVDKETINLLKNATEKELYLSNISPLGVPFNSVKNTTNEHFKQLRIDKQKPGSACPKKFLALNKEYNNKGQCTASRKYQDLKLKGLQEENLSKEEIERKKKSITEKSCLCVGLANPAYIDHDINIKGEAQGVVVCPGPNIAYFKKETSLADMIGHIYGKNDLLENTSRPNMFIKELQLNVNYLETEISKHKKGDSSLTEKKLTSFKNNLLKGVEYYKHLFNNKEQTYFNREKEQLLIELNDIKLSLEKL